MFQMKTQNSYTLHEEAMEPKENKQVDRLLDLDEAAEQLGYKPSGLYEIVKRTKKGKPGRKFSSFRLAPGQSSSSRSGSTTSY